MAKRAEYVHREKKKIKRKKVTEKYKDQLENLY